MIRTTTFQSKSLKNATVMALMKAMMVEMKAETEVTTVVILSATIKHTSNFRTEIQLLLITLGICLSTSLQSSGTIFNVAMRV